MPRRTEAVTSDSEIGRPLSSPAKKNHTVKQPRQASMEAEDVSEVEKEVKMVAADSDAEDEEEEQEEEYEIERIIEAKKGRFPGGRMGYFVKWKGYSEEHNSWVDEMDAGNAQDLIDQFWASKKKESSSSKAPRKSEPTKKHQKSAIMPKADNAEAPEEDEEDQRAKKKARKSNGTGRPSKQQESDDDDILGNMRKHMNVASWENLVQSIDTVERTNDGELIVYFTLKNEKKRMRENSRLCAQKFPQKLITFYESNLRWKIDDPADSD
ncbi:hypothetical protein BU15DRAFT_42196 [Melanogaster broomeanus]|nr:hypothetical protein BU15DRAFT_42196 [Melanogaster broomeanus]